MAPHGDAQILLLPLRLIEIIVQLRQLVKTASRPFGHPRPLQLRWLLLHGILPAELAQCLVAEALLGPVRWLDGILSAELAQSLVADSRFGELVLRGRREWR